jgi:hypothetical protein
MNGRWHRIRLTPLQLGLVALASAAATALLIASAMGRSPAQSAALVALRTKPYQVRLSPAELPVGAGGDSTPVASAASGDVAAPSTTSGGGSGATPAATAPAPAAAQTSTPAASAAAQPAPATAPSSTSAGTPRIGHVFVIALSTPSFDAAFGAGSPAHYLNHVLRPKGTLLGGYETLGDAQLPDYLAMISGQAPNPDTNSECPTFAEFAAGAKPGADGQLAGAGCVYPNTVLTPELERGR